MFSVLGAEIHHGDFGIHYKTGILWKQRQNIHALTKARPTPAPTKLDHFSPRKQ